mmetsp:Transcript_51557/g.134678  ORF Transcript_51557/g.134678 Transcript_51557/m.134678 type:complete len:88 (-) Transcript_51557:236-499(-)
MLHLSDVCPSAATRSEGLGRTPRDFHESHFVISRRALDSRRSDCSKMFHKSVDIGGDRADGTQGDRDEGTQGSAQVLACLSSARTAW